MSIIGEVTQVNASWYALDASSLFFLFSSYLTCFQAGKMNIRFSQTPKEHVENSQLSYKKPLVEVRRMQHQDSDCIVSAVYPKEEDDQSSHRWKDMLRGMLQTEQEFPDTVLYNKKLIIIVKKIRRVSLEFT